MRKIVIVLCLLIVILSPAISQKNLKPGFIISNQLDTTYGFIDSRGDILNCSKCDFYINEKSNPITYNPGEIYAYRFMNDRYFISRNIKVGSEEKTVFLEYLVNGITNLYYLRDNNGDHYFIEKGVEIYELTNKVTHLYLPEGEFNKSSNFYIGQMKLIYSDAQDILPGIDDTKFERESMMKLSEKYHNLVCKDRECITYEKKIKNLKFNVGPVISYQWSKYSYQGFLSPFNFDAGQTLYMGLAINTKFPTINEKLNIRIESKFGKESSRGSYTKTEFSQTTEDFVEYERNKIITSLDLRYEYPKGKIRPTASIGGEFTYVPHQSSNHIHNVYDNNGDLSETVNSNEKIRFNSSGGIFGAIGFSLPVGKHFFLLDLFYNYSWGWYKWGTAAPKNSTVVSNGRTNESSLGTSISFLF